MPAAEPGRSERGSAAERVVVVADLHISAGAGAPLFAVDEAFARFIEYVATHDQRRVSALLLAGDFFDFVHATRGKRAWRDTSDEASLRKLEVIADARPVVMGVLADLAASGVRLAFVPGNHDLEFVRPSAQRLFRELLAARRSGAGDEVDFHPWIVYRRGFLYAEHGSQYHDLNAVGTLLAPSPRRLETPLGAHVDRYRLDRAAGTRGRAHLRLGAALAARVLRLVDARSRLARRRYREAVFDSVAQEIGLESRTLASLDRLAPLAPLAFERRVAHQALGALSRRRKRARLSQENYLEQAAVAIDALLARDRAAVPFYLFGHTHISADRPLRPGREAPRYLNPGTWSTILPRALRSAGDRARFGFVELERSEDGDPSARLLRWDDARRAPAPV